MERIPQVSIAITENGAPQEAEARRVSRFTKYENYQGVWMENMRGSLMLVATVIATMNFQIAINPPGSVWQGDTGTQSGCTPQTCKPGTSVFAHSTEQVFYETFLIFCTISFSASLSIILLLICGFPLSNRLVMWMLIIAMCISVYFTAAAYIVSISMVMKPLDDAVSNIIWYYAGYWIGLFALVSLVHLIRLLWWLVKKLLNFLIPIIRLLCCDG